MGRRDGLVTESPAGRKNPDGSLLIMHTCHAVLINDSIITVATSSTSSGGAKRGVPVHRSDEHGIYTATPDPSTSFSFLVFPLILIS